MQSSVPSFTKGLKKKGKFESFDSAHLVFNYINDNQLHADKDAINSKFSELIKSVDPDLRHKAHGHDFIELLFDYLNSRGKIKLSDKGIQVRDHGNRILISSITSRMLFMEPNFSKFESAAKTGGVTLWI